MLSRADVIEFAEAVHTQYKQLVKKPEPTRDGGEYIHWSSLLYNDCPRFYYIAKDSPNDCIRYPMSVSEKDTHKIGRASERLEREVLLEVFNKRDVFGTWTCCCGFTRQAGLNPPNGICKKCNNPVDNYDEYTVKDDTFKITGNPDFLPYRKGEIIIYELKTARIEDFREYQDSKTANLKHIEQASGYYYLLKRVLPLSISPYFIIRYTCKRQLSPKEDPKYEFVGDATDSLVFESIKSKFRTASQANQAWQDREIPERCCKDFAEGKRRQCLAARKCFSTVS